MLGEVLRFHRAANRLLHDDSGSDLQTLGSFLDRQRFSQFFIDYFMTPLIAAVWSCAPGQAMCYPARYLFRFLEHHGMLTVFGSPPRRTVTGGSANYVNAVVSRLDAVSAGIPVRSVPRVVDGVIVHADGAAPWSFDAVVIAVQRYRPHRNRWL
jgi:predicted NAD/FAD-binding protein